MPSASYAKTKNEPTHKGPNKMGHAQQCLAFSLFNFFNFI
jgi:hypothetical protein